VGSYPPTRQPVIQGRRVSFEPATAGTDGGVGTSRGHQGKGCGGGAREVLGYRQRPPSEPPPEVTSSVNDVSSDAQASDGTENITSTLVSQKKKKRTRKDKGRAGHAPPPITLRHKSDPHNLLLFSTGGAQGGPGEDRASNNNNNGDVRHTKRSKPLTPQNPRLCQSTSVKRYDFSISTVADDNVKAIVEMLKSYLFTEVDWHRVEAIVLEAYEDNDKNFSIREAVEWGAGFTIPRGVVEADEALLASFGGDLEAMAEDRLQQGLANRLNHERVNSLLSDNPETDRLHGLVDGMEIFLPDEFVPNGQGEWPKLRNKYMEASCAVNKMILKVQQKKLAFILWKSTVRKIDGAHASPTHWTEKKDKPEGRTLMDLTDDTRGALNTDDAREKAKAAWLAISHFTIIMFINMLLEFYDQCVQDDPSTTWGDIVIYKMDLKGAFNLLSIKSGSVKHMAVELTDDMVAVFNCGMFGWCGTPYAFQVVTRALHHQMIHKLFGPSMMFVDDHCAVTLRQRLESDKAIARAEFVSLLGDEAPEDTKTIASCDHDGQADIIGYLVDVRLQVVSITKKNFYKTLYGFFTVDLGALVPVRTLEKLASWASRYVTICRWLTPFTVSLYKAYAGLRRNVSVALTDEAKTSIRLWRAALCALNLEPAKFARPFHTFRSTPYKVALEFDSSLKGVGVLVFVKPANEELIVGGCCVSLDCLELSKSDYQNMCEFIGIVVGLATLRRLGLLHPSDGLRESIHLRGDSVSALTWAEDERYTGSNVSNSSIVYTLMLLIWSGNVSSTEHIDGIVRNKRCDYLSRNPHTAQLSDPEVGCHGVTQVVWNGDPIMDRILRLCDPRTDSKSEEGFRSFWKEAHECIRAL
jgi:hypothetical protein